MHNIIEHRKCSRYLALVLFSNLSLILFMRNHASGQNNRAVPGETVVCKLTINVNKPRKAGNNLKTANTNETITNNALKVYHLKPNQAGCFDQVSNLNPLEILPIEILYPQGSVGEKVLLSAEDGGKFDNGKRITILELNADKKIAFTFQVSENPGIFHIRLRKANDIKVIQLWVGEDPAAIRN